MISLQKNRWSVVSSPSFPDMTYENPLTLAHLSIISFVGDLSPLAFQVHKKNLCMPAVENKDLSNPINLYTNIGIGDITEGFQIFTHHSVFRNVLGILYWQIWAEINRKLKNHTMRLPEIVFKEVIRTRRYQLVFQAGSQKSEIRQIFFSFLQISNILIKNNEG